MRLAQAGGPSVVEAVWEAASASPPTVPAVEAPPVAAKAERAPDWYASSPIARRPFCRECGTPLGFEYPDAARCDLTVGSFDDPSCFVPTSHFGVEAMHAAWLDTRGLPVLRCDEYASLVDRWKAVGLDVPE